MNTCMVYITSAHIYDGRSGMRGPMSVKLRQLDKSYAENETSLLTDQRVDCDTCL